MTYRLATLASVKGHSGWLSVVLASIVVSLVLHSDALVRHFRADGEKVGVLISGPRTQTGDNYYYFTLLRHAPERLWEPESNGDPDGGDHRNVNSVSSTYAAALYAGHLLFQVADALTATSREAVLLTSVMSTMVLALAFMTFVNTLAGGWRWGPFALVFAGMLGLVFVDAFSLMVYRANFDLGEFIQRFFAAQEPNALRFVNPTLFWAIGLGAAAAVVRWIRSDRRADWAVAVALVGLSGLFSIGIGATLAGALGLVFVLEVLHSKAFPKRLAVMVAVALAAAAWTYLRTREYAATPLGVDLRHGEFLRLTVKWHFFGLFVLLPAIWYSLGKERVFVCALLIMATVIASVCDSVHLGSRLWTRGSVVFVWAAIVYLVVSVGQRSGVRGGWWAVLAGTVVVWFLWTPHPNAGPWRGYIEKDKWEVLHWIDSHVAKDAVVASAELEDAVLMPIYTKAKPLYAMYGLTSRMQLEESRRYYYNMGLFGLEGPALAKALTLTKQDMSDYFSHMTGDLQQPWRGGDAPMFLHLVLYYRYSHSLSGILADAKRHEAFARMLSEQALQARGTIYAYDYLIVRKAERQGSLDAAREIVYENDTFVVARQPGAGFRGSLNKHQAPLSSH